MLPGLVIQSEPKRLYPAGKAVAHLVGYVAEVTETDLTENRYPGADLGTIVGKAGLERQYDDTLRGAEGVRYIEVNARGRLVREDAGGGLAAAHAGSAVFTTTIDLELQRYMDSIWPAGVRGAMIAMTPGGQIRALYSAPTLRSRTTSSAGSRASCGARSTRTRPGRCSTGPSRRATRRPRRSSSPSGAMALKRGLIGLDTHMPSPCRGGHAAGQPGLPLLEEGRPRLARPDRRGGRELRRLLLPARPPPRAQRHHRGRRADGLPATRAGSTWRTRRTRSSPRTPPTSTGSTGRGTGARRPRRSTSRSARARTPRPWST